MMPFAMADHVLPALQPREDLVPQTAMTGAVGGELSAGDRASSGTVRPGLGHDSDDYTPAALHRYVTRLYQRQGGQSWTR